MSIICVSSLSLQSVELDDMRKTDQIYADAETNYGLAHPGIAIDREQNNNRKLVSLPPKRQVEEYQNADHSKMMIELEERFNK